ncbi:MAG TPA: hypothetical protein VNO82_18400 [Solirubrobacteraceae bacterium]|nr:hypothetical protein [Solirubrobacteraceae bacterium]
MTELPSSLRSYRFALERAAAADLARRRRRRVGGVAAAVAVVLVVVNLLPSGGDRPGGVAPASAVERAAAALQPADGTILHFHMKGRQFEDGRPDIRWEHESWTLVGTGDNRTVQAPPFGPTTETAYVDGIESAWDEAGGRVVEKAVSRPEGSTPAANGEFRDEIMALLRAKRAKVTRLTRDGATVLRIAAGSRSYLVDAESYAPIEMRTRGTSGGTVLRFVTYESLPPDGDLLSIAAQHDGARVVRDAEAYDALLQRLFANG